MGRRGSRQLARPRIVGAVDLGSSKIACLIAEVAGSSNSQDQTLRVLGAGLQRSQGIKGGVVIDPALAESALRSAVAQAERAAGMSLSEVYLSLTGGRLASLSFAAHADIAAGGVTAGDIDRLFTGARAFAERDGRSLVHMNRKAFSLDGSPAGDDPRGLAARRLTADIHAVTADESAMRNLMLIVERCQLEVAGFIAAPFASALAVTGQDERQLGVTVIDMGGGTTTIAAFSEGQLCHCTAFPTGGNHLTFDIAQNLHSPIAEAERIKTLYASMVNAQSDVCDRFSYSVAGESEPSLGQATRAELADAVRPRVENLLGQITDRLAAAGIGAGPVIMTGGASGLVGMAEFASQCLNRDVWLGRPRAGLALPASAGSPAMAAAVGLALAAPDGVARVGLGRGDGAGYLRRVGRWFHSSF